MSKHKLSPMAFGLSLGVVWGMAVFLMGLFAHFFMYGTLFVAALGTLYIGYKATLAGVIIGGVWGFVDAFITGVIIAWLYHWFSGCCDNDK